jgi:glycolate oxidase subunit GlcD
MGYIEELKTIVGGENVHAGMIDRIGFSRDMSVHQGLPDVIVFAQTSDQVSRIVKIAAAQTIPVVARGAGTSVTGAVLPARGGILLDLSRMNQVIEINKNDGYVVVEPGIICNALNARLEPTHFFPPDPGSAPACTLGGMIACNASGVRAVKYGTTRDYVKGLEVVLADGQVIHTGTLAPKSSAGYDLTRLFSTSEGTLGIITAATLKILPKPPYLAFAKLLFPSVDQAGEAVVKILTSGIPLSACEILDEVSIGVVKQAMNLEIPPQVKCLLFVEIDGHRQAVTDQMAQIDAICQEFEGLGNEWSDDPAKRLVMWSARQGLVPSLSRVKPGYRQIPIVEDFGVPISQIKSVIHEIQKIGREHDSPIATFGHIGDGNLHAVLIMDVRKAGEWETLRKIGRDFLTLTLKYKGTLTAEHGLGMAKSPFIREELGPALEVMKTIKKALDPQNILNPGKLGFEDSIKDIYEKSAYAFLIEKPEEIKSFGEKIDQEIMACILCGFCRAGCPTYTQTGLETMNARGRVLLAFNLMSGQLPPSEEVAQRLYQCTTCLNCKYTCPSRVEVSDVVQAARKRLADSGFLPPVFQASSKSIDQYGNPFGEPREKRTDVFPDNYKTGGKGAEVLLFAGCVASYQDINMVSNLITILDKAGIAYTTLGQEEDCCGYLSYLTGAEGDFQTCVKNNTKKFADLGVKEIVTSCPGCFRTLSKLYPDYGGNRAIKVHHVVTYLNDLMNQGKISLKGGGTMVATFHDPCDLGRHMQVFEEPRNLLKQIPGLQLNEFKMNRLLAKCCGSGGGVKGFDNQLSQDIAYDRVLQALEVGAEVIVSACPSCKSNLTQGAARLRKEKKGKIKVKDITEMIASALV